MCGPRRRVVPAGPVRSRAGGIEKSHAGTEEPPGRLPRKLGDCSAGKSRFTILCAHPGFVSSLLVAANNRNRYNTPHRFRPAIPFAFQRGITDRGFSSRSASSFLKSLHQCGSATSELRFQSPFGDAQRLCRLSYGKSVSLAEAYSRPLRIWKAAGSPGGKVT